MNLQDLFHWIYVALMAIGAIYFLVLSTNPKEVPKHEYYVAAFIPIWSGLAYMSMALPEMKHCFFVLFPFSLKWGSVSLTCMDCVV
jgi:bacteriorhodopsin